MEAKNLKPEEFDAHIEKGTFRLAFVGMSNAGKSYRSRTLRDEADFLWYQVDAEIQKKMGFKDMAEISKWLGYPGTKGYGEREREYLEIEGAFTKHASMQTNGKNLVFDTTGSVVHLSQDVLDILKENCLVVNLEVGEDSVEKMIETFFKEPKSVAWTKYFNMKKGESEKDALRRCYPLLLRERLKAYRSLSNVNIPAFALRDKSAEETLAIIRSHL